MKISTVKISRNICKICKNSRNPLATSREELIRKKSDSKWKMCNASDSEKREKSRHSESDFHGTPRKFTRNIISTWSQVFSTRSLLRRFCIFLDICTVYLNVEKQPSGICIEFKVNLSQRTYYWPGMSRVRSFKNIKQQIMSQILCV